LPEDIEVVVVGAHFEKLIVRSVPLVDNFLDHVIPIAQPEPDGPLVGFSPRVALDL
jgi:hypothetical protein